MVSKAKIAANRRHDDKKYDRYTLRLTKEEMERVRAHIASLNPNMSLNAYITGLILDDLSRADGEKNKK